MNEVVKYFLASYFHQDWREDYGDSMEALSGFMRCENNKTKSELLNALIKLRAREDVTKLELRSLGANLNPETEGLSVGAWLDKVISILNDRPESSVC